MGHVFGRRAGRDHVRFGRKRAVALEPGRGRPVRAAGGIAGVFRRGGAHPAAGFAFGFREKGVAAEKVKLELAKRARFG